MRYDAIYECHAKRAVAVLKIIKLSAGTGMALRCMAVIRGTRRPRSVLVRSNSALASGVWLLMPPTP